MTIITPYCIGEKETIQLMFRIKAKSSKDGN